MLGIFCSLLLGLGAMFAPATNLNPPPVLSGPILSLPLNPIGESGNSDQILETLSDSVPLIVEVPKINGRGMQFEAKQPILIGDGKIWYDYDPKRRNDQSARFLANKYHDYLYFKGKTAGAKVIFYTVPSPEAPEPSSSVTKS